MISGLTLVQYKGNLLADPCHEEESIAEALLSMIVDEKGRIVSAYKPGGRLETSESAFVDAVASAQIRYKDIAAALSA